MAHHKGIGPTLFGKSRLAILCLLLVADSQRFYLRQIVSLTGLGFGAVQRELAALTECGILTREKEGRQVYFQANPACPVIEELKAIIVKTAGVADVLQECLLDLQGSIEVAFIYGSFAEGADRAESDIDVMVIGAASFAEVCEALGDVQARLRREINPTVYPVEEFRSKHNTPFLRTVLSNPKILLIGDQSDLEGLAG